MAQHETSAAALSGPTRRGFLVGSAAAGAGLMMGFAMLPRLNGSSGEAFAAARFSPNVWFTMDEAGIATVHCTKAEMGQHVGTAIAQALAEELEVRWENVRVDYPDTHPKYGLFVTGGSWSINYTFDQMSRAGAAGRIALMEAAVKRWGVALADLRAEDGVIHHDKSGRRVSYAELVQGGITPRVFGEAELKALSLKPADRRKLVGKSVPALDIPAKTNGSAKYGIDAFVPGMAYGAPVTPPTRHGAKVLGVDETEARKVPGYLSAVTLQDPTGTVTGWVVAVAESYPAAKLAAEALQVRYDAGPNEKVSSDSIMTEARRLQADPAAGLAFVKDGDATAALAKAASRHEAAYTTALTLHMPLEPMNAIAELKEGVWHIHAGNQFQTLALGLLPVVLGVKPEQVVLHQHYLGGGFGRRLDADYLIVAALTAKGAGRPVKVIYTREHDTRTDFPRSITYQVLKAGLDAKGNLVGMSHDVVGAWATARQAPPFLADSVDKKGKVDAFSVNGADHWYSVPNHTVRAILNQQAQGATPPGHLRSVAPGWTFWALESFIDELAHKAKKDPVALRLALLDAAGKQVGAAPMSVQGAKRLANVLNLAVEKSGYGKRSLPKGTALGVACASAQERATPAWTACVAEVQVAADGGYKVRKLTLVSDVGTAVNPDGVKAQLEGASLWGLSIATKEQASLKDGRIEQANFDTYAPVRMEDVPELDIHVVSTGDYPVGCGEPATTVVAPAIANAIFNAAGARVRSLPITPEAVKAAMKA